ncbi:hypothetical protein RBEAN4_1281 [Rickettsia bellii str. RML An4]|uniref:Uncharacterized protein n=1 Tax=Rickettsia bellii str. RML An4 TaxID=1359193 RepID=A0A0F3QCL4_RICBE|nr:hypothetical protein [Rickettsia bellii]KJV90278.1 hypothetical protein RBEAN4_1281 [Rickettsia bellii str. RML An4]
MRYVLKKLKNDLEIAPNSIHFTIVHLKLTISFIKRYYIYPFCYFNQEL